MKQMVLVNKEEATAIRDKYSELKITRTCRQHSQRHRYYAPLTKGVTDILDKMRYGNVVWSSDNSHLKNQIGKA